MNNIQINAAVAGVSETGTGIATSGSARTLNIIAASNNSASDVTATQFTNSTTSRTASTVWTGWTFTQSTIGSGSTISDYTKVTYPITLGKNLDTLRWLVNPTHSGAFTVTKNYGILQQTATLNGIGTLFPTRNMDVRGTARFADFYNQNDSTGVTGQFPVKRGTGWGWRGLLAADIPDIGTIYARLGGNTGTVTIGSNDNTLALETNGTTRMTIGTDGKVTLTEGIIDNLVAEVTTTGTAQKFKTILVDVSAGVATITPPSSPVAGDWFCVSDSRANAATFNITVDVSGDNLHAAANDYVMNTNADFLKLTYVNATIGWIKSN